MTEWLTCFGLGWFFGASVMWWYFHHNDLIRSRVEWHEARRGKGG